jgi:hypothetical protein
MLNPAVAIAAFGKRQKPGNWGKTELPQVLAVESFMESLARCDPVEANETAFTKATANSRPI